jgi:quercetin dioxygenase-like cupin family protein
MKGKSHEQQTCRDGHRRHPRIDARRRRGHPDFQQWGQPSTIGSQEFFAGHTVVDSLFPANEFTHGTGGHVTFAPGARTAWHTHPAGQTLIVTSGSGWVQEEGKERNEIKPGDVVWIAPGVKHWHGATDTSGMGHIAISYMLDGINVEWMEQVSSEQYRVKATE